MEGCISEELLIIFIAKTKNDEKYYEEIFTYLKDSKIIVSFSLNKIRGNNIYQNIIIITN